MTRPASDSIERFNDRAEDYVRYRPAYPPAAIDAILEGLPAVWSLMVADIGAGTGISARLLADRGARVIAVEPGTMMRGAAAPHANVRWLAGRAESTGLLDSSVDLVVCAQAFHWFTSAEAVAEFARVLKPGGRLAIMWNRRSRTDPLTAAYRQAILDVGGETAAERMGFEVSIVTASPLFREAGRVAFPNEQPVDVDGLIGRARSASYVPRAGAAGERLRELLRLLHSRYADADGIVRLIYETEVFRFTRN
jgi:SAM-dependent methyltransferase